MRRSPVPVSVTEADLQAFLDELWKRRVAAVSQLSANPTNEEIATAFNALIVAMQARGAMEAT
jgi:hypothetical protein